MPASPSFDTRRPFTRAHAVAAGVDRKFLRSSRFRRVFRGVYVDAKVEQTPMVLARAALAMHPSDAFASHQTAAALRGLPGS